MSKISGKRVIITGGARGIGGEAVKYFVNEGAKVVSFDVRDEEGQALAKLANERGPGSVSYQHVDVTDIASINAGVTAALAILGGLDSVINVAGVAPHAPAENIPEADWDILFAVNVKGLHYVCATAFPHLKENGGTIINFGSDAGLIDDPIHSCAYSASKGAVISYSRTLAKEWAKYNIRVNSVNPVVYTSLLGELMAGMTDDERADYDRKVKDAVPLGGKVGDAYSDLAPVLAFLVSEDARFITSQIIPVNGGLAYTR